MQSNQPVSRWQTAVWAGLILVATSIAYLPVFQCGFIWDDNDYVTNNLTLRDLQGLKSIWLDPSATPQYYPLVHSTFWIEYQTWGLNATGYHATNVVIHAINAVLLWRLLLALSVPGAWLAALVFAVHPVHVESVAWITERKNVLSGMFYLLSMLSFLRYWDFSKSTKAEGLESTTRRAWVWFLAAHVFFVAALLSKTITATLPAVLIVLVWWKQGSIPIKRLLSLIPMFLVGIAFGLMTVWLEKFQVGASGIDWELSLLERFLIAGRALWFYAGKLLWPSNLIFTYPRWDIDATQLWQFVFPIATVVVIMSLWVLRGKIGRGPLAAILVFAGTLFPALGFLDVYPMRFSFVADHFQYLASVALIALGAALAAQFADRKMTETPVIRWLAGAGVVVTMMGLTWQQTKIYESLETLWRDTLDKNPTSFMAHNNLGALLNRREEYIEAEKHIREAMILKPDFIDAVVNMGKAREGQGDLNEATKYYRKAIEMNPSFAPALNGLGAMVGAKGDMQEAKRLFELAVQSNPKYAPARVNLAILYQGSNQPDKAIEELQQALRYQPDMVAARDTLIRNLMQLERFDEAKELLVKSLAENPGDVNLLGALGVIAANQKDFRAAIGYFENVVSIVPNEPNALFNLSAMHRELGENEKADQYMKLLEQIQASPPLP